MEHAHSINNNYHQETSDPWMVGIVTLACKCLGNLIILADPEPRQTKSKSL